MKQQNVRVSNVFVPGGFPQITYIPREGHKLEDRVRIAQDNLSKLMVITGPTKSGKTVLVDKIFPQDSAIWIDGGVITDEQSFWDLVIDKLDLFTNIGYSHGEGDSSEIGGNVSAEGNLFFAKGGASVNSKLGASTTENQSNSRNISAKVAATSALRTNPVPLVVDDFHYIEKTIQKNLVRALKAPIMHGLPVIFIAIPNRKYDAVEVEREMTGRIENIEMPIWEDNELGKIATQGFSALNINTDDTLIQNITSESYGSPFLMQEFCKAICAKNGIVERNQKVQDISTDIDISEIFADIAEHSGRSMFDKLKRGPRPRTDRIQRSLSDGTTTDIYGVVMNAFKLLKPGVESVSYDLLRSNIRTVIDGNLPQKNEISRVLDKIAEISYTDSSSTPVLDWQRDDDLITITDPFFAFFLKWAR